ncbi:MAG: hypothetical protein H7Z13_04660, partial [Ferruginibacter sp.]|nr:hypothetical protein [Ferruginibacter sp.]
PETFQIDNINQLVHQQYDDQFVENFNGACVVEKEVLLQLKGYDEFYLVWGAEDDDLMRRLEDAGALRKHISTCEINIYHQWHPSGAPSKPTLWYLIMVNHLFAEKQYKDVDMLWGVTYTLKDRPVLKFIDDGGYKQGARLEFENHRSLFFFNPFIQGFHQLKTREIAYLDYTCITPKVDNTRSFSFIKKPKLKSSETERISRKDIAQFFQYFIGCNRALMQDYYYEESGNKFLFVCIKK